MADQVAEAAANDSLMRMAGLGLTKLWWETAREAFSANGRATLTGTGPSWPAA